MATARDEMRTLIAAAALETARAWGVSVSFSHRSANAATIYAILSGDNIAALEDGGTFSEIRNLVLAIPLQTNFATTTDETEPITLADKISYNSREYFVTSISKDSFGAVYRVELEETKRIYAGVS